MKNISNEFRLGKFNGTFFDTNIGEKMYISILKGLSKYTGWDRIVQSETEVFFREKDNLRITIDESTNEETIIKKERCTLRILNNLKERLLIYDFQCVKKYQWTMTMKVKWMVKKQKRTSYIRKNVSIDVTSISGNTQDMDSEDPFTYQVEFEIIKPQNVEDKDTLFNIIHKIKDLFNIL